MNGQGASLNGDGGGRIWSEKAECRDGCAGQDAGGSRVGMEDPGVPSLRIRQPEIVGRREDDRAADVQRRIRAEDDAGWVHQEEIGTGITRGIDSAKNSGGASAGYPSQDIESVEQRRRIQELCSMVVPHAELVETMKETCSVAVFRPGSSRDLNCVAMCRDPGPKVADAGCRINSRGCLSKNQRGLQGRPHKCQDEDDLKSCVNRWPIRDMFHG